MITGATRVARHHPATTLAQVHNRLLWRVYIQQLHNIARAVVGLAGLFDRAIRIGAELQQIVAIGHARHFDVLIGRYHCIRPSRKARAYLRQAAHEIENWSRFDADRPIELAFELDRYQQGRTTVWTDWSRRCDGKGTISLMPSTDQTSHVARSRRIIQVRSVQNGSGQSHCSQFILFSSSNYFLR